MRRSRSANTPRGIALIHLLGVVLLLGSVMVVSVQIFAGSVKASRRAVVAQEKLDRFDTMIAALRKDVWGAASMELRDGRLVLNVSGRPPIEWTTLEAVTRTQEGQPPRTWRHGPAMRLEIIGGVLKLTADDAGEVVLALPSQVMLAEGRP